MVGVTKDHALQRLNTKEGSCNDDRSNTEYAVENLEDQEVNTATNSEADDSNSDTGANNNESDIETDNRTLIKGKLIFRLSQPSFHQAMSMQCTETRSIDTKLE